MEIVNVQTFDARKFGMQCRVRAEVIHGDRRTIVNFFSKQPGKAVTLRRTEIPQTRQLKTQPRRLTWKLYQKARSSSR
jgi:hypothetical protein